MLHIKNKDVPELVNLSRAITESLKIVWIPLDEKKDDPQAIFESLNDAGMPLSAAELLCNYMFKPLINESTNEHEELHNNFWLKARKSVGSGEFENYLQNLFSIGEKKKVGQGRKMYVHFKARNRNMSKDSARKVLQDILNYATLYNSINKPISNPHPDSEIKKWLIAIEQTNMRAVTPFLLALLMTLKQGGISVSEAAKILKEVYVLLIRRKIADLRVTKYNTLFPNLLSRILQETDKIKALQEEFQKEGMWVSDQDFKDAFLNKELYNSRELNFTRHVLQEIDKAMQNHGEFPDYSTISTIEHILPQTLNPDWKTYLGEEANHTDLKRISNSLGNLCLNSHSANSSFGQKSFADKQEAYNDSSALARDVKKRKEPWNMEAIKARSRDLAEIGLNVWKWSI